MHFVDIEPATWTQAVRDLSKGTISDLVVGGGGNLPVSVVEVEIDDEYSWAVSRDDVLGLPAMKSKLFQGEGDGPPTEGSTMSAQVETVKTSGHIDNM